MVGEGFVLAFLLLYACMRVVVWREFDITLLDVVRGYGVEVRYGVDEVSAVLLR